MNGWMKWMVGGIWWMDKWTDGWMMGIQTV